MNKEIAYLEQLDKYVSLYDSYKELLTEKQKSYFESYYFENMSFQEIAQYYNVSRNAIFDQMKKTIKLLEEYESKLHLVKLYDQRNEIYDKILVKLDSKQKEIEDLILELKELE